MRKGLMAIILLSIVILTAILSYVTVYSFSRLAQDCRHEVVE